MQGPIAGRERWTAVPDATRARETDSLRHRRAGAKQTTGGVSRALTISR